MPEFKILKEVGKKAGEHDIEGRCSECGRPLDIIMVIKHRTRMDLHVKPCPDHEDGAMILWPWDRDDLTVWWVDDGGINVETHEF